MEILCQGQDFLRRLGPDCVEDCMELLQCLFIERLEVSGQRIQGVQMLIQWAFVPKYTPNRVADLGKFQRCCTLFRPVYAQPPHSTADFALRAGKIKHFLLFRASIRRKHDRDRAACVVILREMAPVIVL